MNISSTALHLNFEKMRRGLYQDGEYTKAIGVAHREHEINEMAGDTLEEKFESRTGLAEETAPYVLPAVTAGGVVLGGLWGGLATGSWTGALVGGGGGLFGGFFAAALLNMQVYTKIADHRAEREMLNSFNVAFKADTAPNPGPIPAGRFLAALDETIETKKTKGDILGTRSLTSYKETVLKETPEDFDDVVVGATKRGASTRELLWLLKDPDFDKSKLKPEK